MFVLFSISYHEWVQICDCSAITTRLTVAEEMDVNDSVRVSGSSYVIQSVNGSFKEISTAGRGVVWVRLRGSVCDLLFFTL